MDGQEAKARIGGLHSASLRNRNPPYAIPGGVYDALRDSAGQTYAVTSEEALLAGWLFESLEGCDLDPAAEVAVAGLVRTARQGRIGAGDLALLNLTGGGR
jgi:cysteate synthase